MGAPVNVTPPTIVGTAAINTPLLCDHEDWTSDGGDITYSYSWHRAEEGGQEFAAIPFAENVAYLPTLDDVGYVLRCLVVASNGDGNTGAYTDPTAAVPDFGYFVVEDGTGLINANSLAAVADADVYHALRNNATWTNADLGTKQTALVRATDYIELRWGARLKGVRQFPENPQNLSYPRLYIDSDGAVPLGVQKACAEYALRALSSPLVPDPPAVTTARPVELLREKVGPLETETRYSAGATLSSWQSYPVPDGLMKPFIAGGSGLIRA